VRSAALILTLGCATVLAAGCAAHPQQPGEANKGAGAQSAPASASSASAAPTLTAAVASATPSLSPDVLKKARDLGYKPEVFNGRTVFCVRETRIGSRFPLKRCLEPADLDLMIEKQFLAQDQMRDMQCHGGACGGVR
jgi:hypothetical protein